MKYALAASMFVFPVLGIVVMRLDTRRRRRIVLQAEFGLIASRERANRALAESSRPTQLRHGAAGVGHAVRHASASWVEAGVAGGAATTWGHCWRCIQRPCICPDATRAGAAYPARSNTSSGVFTAAGTAGL